MPKKYKKSYLVINIILGLVLLFLILNLFTFKNTNYLFCILNVLIPFVVITLIYGYEHKKRRFMYELIFYVFAYSIVFLLITYFLGIFTGFSQNVYKLNISNLIHNIIPYSLLIFISELFRYEITRKGEGSILAYVLITLILILIDMTLFLNNYDLSIGDNIIKYISIIILPSIFKNTLLLYCTKVSGIIPSIIYRIIFDLRIVILPIIPNFGLYFEAILNCIMPVLMWIVIELSLKKFKKRDINTLGKKSKPLFAYIVLAILIIITIGVNLLGSGNFKYTMISIGSGSMTPEICKGDVVIYQKIENTLPLLGEILVFKKENKVVVHRIIDVIPVNEKENIYYTKGDANESEDGYPIEMKDILGIAKYRFKYIGMPSVMLGELIHK